jgi:hypothetical protein
MMMNGGAREFATNLSQDISIDLKGNSGSQMIRKLLKKFVEKLLQRKRERNKRKERDDRTLMITASSSPFCRFQR